MPRWSEVWLTSGVFRSMSVGRLVLPSLLSAQEVRLRSVVCGLLERTLVFKASSAPSVGSDAQPQARVTGSAYGASRHPRKLFRMFLVL